MPSNTRAYSQAYYKEHREVIQESSRANHARYRSENRNYQEKRRLHLNENGLCQSCGCAPRYNSGVYCIEHAALSAAKRHGLTIEHRLMLYASQNGQCLLCGTFEPDPLKLVVDHDHTTGHIRGMLCNKHNRAIGAFGDSSVALRQAAHYIDDSVLVFKSR